MAKDRYAPKQLNEVLGSLNPKLGSKMASYSEKSQHLQSQQQVLAQAVGENLAKKCAVANVRDGTLVIDAQSASIAMKLNYIKMDILSAFRQSGMADLCQVKIQTSPQAASRLKVNSPSTPAQQQKTTLPSRHMSEQTADYLEHIAQNAPPSLQQKLQRLAQHGRQKK